MVAGMVVVIAVIAVLWLLLAS
ncbi:MAG: hypothetical protein QOE61_3612, partial [Micromonosporaceae bacterium]|nr:hypothetical protein [Micromonosporaceae bacterium]